MRQICNKLKLLRPIFIRILQLRRNDCTQQEIADELNRVEAGKMKWNQVKVHRAIKEAEALEAEGFLHVRAVGSQLASNANKNLSLPVPAIDEEMRKAAIEGLQYFREQN
jgi:hypothetical protein